LVDGVHFGNLYGIGPSRKKDVVSRKGKKREKDNVRRKGEKTLRKSKKRVQKKNFNETNRYAKKLMQLLLWMIYLLHVQHVLLLVSLYPPCAYYHRLIRGGMRCE
jgi:hypothetical protein